MTLVELLVVIAILGILAITALPNFSSTREARGSREAARIVSSYIAKAHSQAIGAKEWSGFWMLAPNPNAAALDLSFATTPTVYRGDDLPDLTVPAGYVFTKHNSVVSGTINGKPISNIIGGSTVTGIAGDLLRFDGNGPWFQLDSPTTFRLRSQSTADPIANQSDLNTAWPAANVPHTYELLRQPIQTGSPFLLDQGRCIDLFWSGYGTTASFEADSPTFNGITNSPTRFAGSTAVCILFDAAGRLRQIVRNTARVPVTGPVFLLIGRSDRAGQAYSGSAPNGADDSLGANWQYADSFWLGIDPLTGVVKVAECDLRGTTVVGSQTFIRSEIAVGGR
jgi:type II secretory pathway pseudopilin PulG